jgi:hypothetical protein
VSTTYAPQNAVTSTPPRSPNGRWRLLVEFGRNTADGTCFQAHCKTCHRVACRDANRAQRRQQALGPYREQHNSYADTVDSGPFVEWVERWAEAQDRMRVQQGSKRRWGFDGIERPVATLEDLAELAGVSVRAFSRARTTGRISAAIVDRVLIAAGADTYLWELAPEAYEFDEAAA